MVKHGFIHHRFIRICSPQIRTDSPGVFTMYFIHHRFAQIDTDFYHNYRKLCEFV